MHDPVAVNDSPVNGNVQDGASSTSNGPTPRGFTAVNGAVQRSTSFRPDDSAQPLATSPGPATNHKTASGSTQYQSYGWRPDHSALSGKRPEPQRLEIPTTGKRKRSETGDAEADDNALSAETDRGGGPSPKRGKTRDSAVDLTMSERNDQRTELPLPDRLPPAPAPIGPYQRERSPVARGELPPKPRPETEASLAASLQQFQQTQQQETQQARGHSSPEDSPPDDLDGQQDSQLADDDQLQGGDFDAKKRKRNFSNRTKTGCHTCRGRKKKCDEGKPTCQNCDKGGFQCTGYGPKPPNLGKGSGQSRTVVQIQSKTPYASASGPTGHWSNRQEEGRTYSHWGRVPSDPDPPRQYTAVAPTPPVDPRRPDTADSWQKPMWGPSDPGTSYSYQSVPSSNFAQIAPSYTYGPDHRAPPQHQQPPPPPPQHYQTQVQPPQPPPPLPMPIEPWAQHPLMPPYQQQPGPPTTISSRESVANSSRSGPFTLSYTGNTQHSEKDKMLRGQPFLHYLDSVLQTDRQNCRAAVERYNKAAEMTSGISVSERAKLFTQILQPSKRPEAVTRERHIGPTGSVDVHTVIEPPFKCEYGYNVHIAKECIVEAGCYMQDAADISIGDRVIVGHSVKFYCITASLDPNNRQGSQGHFTAGAIKIEDHVFIGADVVVLPYVTIGKGAVVGAGSVVTKDVREYTVVAGNPAERIRNVESGNMSRHHSHKIGEQEAKMKKWMSEYANSGFALNSPRLI